MGPGRCIVGSGLPPIENIVHMGEKAPGDFVPADRFRDEPMGKGVRMAPGAHPHADIAVTPNLTPIVMAGVGIEFPSPGAVVGFGICQGNGVGRTADRAFLTYPAKILDPDIYRLVRDQGHIGRHRRKP